MEKNELLKCIAETGYNVGFGAKKHFATYDIVSKTNSRIGLFSIIFGIFSLVFEVLTHKFLSASIAILGVIGICSANFERDKESYCSVGKELNNIFLSLSLLYSTVKSADDSADLSSYESDLKKFRDKYNEIGISDQILFSDWYAHYKFFQQTQIEWIDEQKKFTWKDKVPLSARIVAILSIIIIFICLIYFYFLKENCIFS